jgi:hypothetical protein
MAMAMAAQAQQALDFAKKFMTVCEGDTMVRCITVSPKMMDQIVETRQDDSEQNEALQLAMAKLKSARIVSAPAAYYERADSLIKRHARRFKATDDFHDDDVRGAFYTRKDRRGRTAELIMLREDKARNRLTIICLTGDIDKEFLCFLYNKKSLKD